MPTTLIAALVMYGEISLVAATFIANFAISFAASLLITRIFGQDAPKQADNGVRQQIPPSSTNSLPVVYGDAYLGGVFVDAVLSIDQTTMYYVLAISNVSPNGQLTFQNGWFYYGDRSVQFDSVDPTKVISLTDSIGNVDTKISGYLYINLYVSNAAGTITALTGSAPSTVMGGADIDSTLRWPSTGRQMNGLAFAIVKLVYNQAANATSLSPITFHVSHYLNGTGAAKPGDVLYDYLTSPIYGGAALTANVNSTTCTALNTYSDVLMPYTNSSGTTSTQARYRINGVLDTGQTVLNNVDKILTACDSWLSYQATTGQWSPVINKDESVASYAAFDDSNILSEIRISATDLSSSINQIEASFPNAANKDQPAFVYLATPTGLLYPNEPINKYTTKFDLVNNSVQSTYLANRMLEQAREDLVVSFSTAYTGIQVDAGDVISITLPAYGWNAKLWRVTKIQEASLPDGNLGATINCTEYNAAVYDNISITEFAPAANSKFASPYYFPILSAPFPASLQPNLLVPTFVVYCPLPSTGRITEVCLYYTTSSSPAPTDWKVWGIQKPSNTVAFAPSVWVQFTDMILPRGDYYFSFQASNEFGTSTISPMSSVLQWHPVPFGSTDTVEVTPSAAVTVTNMSHVPDGFVWNTLVVTMPFIAGFTGNAQVTFSAQGNYSNSSSFLLAAPSWSIQDTAGTGTYNAWNKVTFPVPASASLGFPISTARTFPIVEGTSYTYAVYANKLSGGDTFTINNMQFFAQLVSS